MVAPSHMRPHHNQGFGNGDTGAFETGERRKPNTACYQCRKGHFRCIGNFPCERCQERGLTCTPLIGTQATVLRLERDIHAISHELATLKTLRNSTRLSQESLLEQTPETSKSFDTFNKLAEVADDLLLHPDHYRTLYPILVSLEREFVGHPSDGIVMFLYKSLQVNFQLFALFCSSPSLSVLAEQFRTKMNFHLNVYKSHLHLLDRAFLTRVMQCCDGSPLKSQDVLHHAPAMV